MKRKKGTVSMEAQSGWSLPLEFIPYLLCMLFWHLTTQFLVIVSAANNAGHKPIPNVTGCMNQLNICSRLSFFICQMMTTVSVSGDYGEDKCDIAQRSLLTKLIT
jgi:hypothetical protein